MPKDQLRRTSFLETNQSHGQESEEEEVAEEAEMQWRTDSEDLYLASVDYGVNLNTSVNKTFEAFGEEAAMHMGTERVGEGCLQAFQLQESGISELQDRRSHERQHPGDGHGDGVRPVQQSFKEDSSW